MTVRKLRNGFEGNERTCDFITIDYESGQEGGGSKKMLFVKFARYRPMMQKLF